MSQISENKTVETKFFKIREGCIVTLVKTAGNRIDNKNFLCLNQQAINVSFNY